MKPTTARLWIFYIWGASFFFLIFIFEMGPVLRRGVIDPDDAHGALIKMAALFTPIIFAFVAFWFRPSTVKPKNRKANNVVTPLPFANWGPAIIITIAYQIILLFFAVYCTYFDSYGGGELNSGGVEPPITFNQWISNILQLGLLLSPIATAPAAFMLGVEEIKPEIAMGSNAGSPPSA